MKLLITGATGFIGRNLTLLALQSPQWTQIILPVRNPTKLVALLAAEGVNPLPDCIRIEAVSRHSWGNALDCDAAVHCAGLLFGRSKQEYWESNVESTLRLLQELPSHARILLISSQSAGGPTPTDREMRDEETPDAPLTFYGASKREMESRCLIQFPDRALLALRLPMVLGPRDQASLALFRWASGRIRFKPGFLPKSYSFVAVEDVCSAIFLALRQDWSSLGQQLYYVAHPQPASDRELISIAGSLLGKNGVVLPLPQSVLKATSILVDAVPKFRQALPSLTRDRAREIWPDRWVVSGRRFERDFRFQCTTGLISALSSTFGWYQKVGLLQG